MIALHKSPGLFFFLRVCPFDHAAAAAAVTQRFEYAHKAAFEHSTTNFIVGKIRSTTLFPCEYHGMNYALCDKTVGLTQVENFAELVFVFLCALTS